jgi:hypothetical protein
VIGHITARWGLAGPVTCTSPAGDALADGLAVARLLLADGDATEVLVIAAELDDNGDRDGATALLVGPARPGAAPGAPDEPR